MIDNINSTKAASATNPLSAQTTPKQAEDIFLKLFSSELTQQNPLSPMDNKEWVEQFVQFSSYNQMATLNRQIESIKQMLGLVQSASLVGKEIVYTNANNIPEQGRVDGIAQKNGELFICVNDKEVAFTDILQVKIEKGEQA